MLKKVGICETMVFAAIWVCFSLAMAMPHIDRQNAVYAAKMATDNQPIIVIDAGHGGFDGGAEGNGVVEKDINLQISKKTELIAQLLGYKTVMTRTTDDDIADMENFPQRNEKTSDMHKRLSMLTEYQGALAVSIHQNKYEKSYVHGAMVYYAPNDMGSSELAQSIQDSIVHLLQADNDKKTVKATNDLFLLYQNNSNPAVIVECGFLSNPDEALLLQDSIYQTKLALAIINGCANISFF